MKLHPGFYSIPLILVFFFLFHIGGEKSANALKSANTPKNKEKIHWISFQEAIVLNQKQPRKIYIDVYTNWCGWCKRMDLTSFENSKVIEEMNSDYYAVKLNAETKDSIVFDHHTFSYSPQIKSNELAFALLHGQLAFPSTVILDKDEKILSRIPGYLEAGPLEEILNYFGKNNYLRFSWNQYQKVLGHDTLSKNRN